MKDEFRVLPSLPLQSQSTYARPQSLPELVHLDSPAGEVMTDLRLVSAVATTPEVKIDDALDKMKHVGIRLLFVVNKTGEVVGLITAKDIQGELPVKLVEERHLTHAELTVEMVMTPQSKITVFDMATIDNAHVGDIVATLSQLNRQHGLAVDVDRESGKQTIRGVFSTTQIGKQLGQELSEVLPPVDSLAELVQTVH